MRPGWLAARASAVLVAAAAAGRPAHPWPHVRGQVGQYGLTHHRAPRNLSDAFAWKWEHPDGRYSTFILGGPLIDDGLNLYISCQEGVYKFSPAGQVLWFYMTTAPTFTVPSIADGALFGHSSDAVVYSLDLETGRPNWMRRHSEHSGSDCAYTENHDGVVLAALESGPAGGNRRIFCMNATNGDLLWSYTMDRLLWNFMPMFPGDGTFVTMDIHGSVYRFGLHDGGLRWSTVVPEGDRASFSDGGVILGPDKTLYGCSGALSYDYVHGILGRATQGHLRAYRVDDGALLWDRELPHPCTSWATSDGRTVVIPSGHLPGYPPAKELPRFVPWAVRVGLHLVGLGLGTWFWELLLGKSWAYPSAVLAFDALTGERLWEFAEVPVWRRPTCRGDEEGWHIRSSKIPLARDVCLTAGWGTPTMAGDGTVYTVHMDGHLYAIRDSNGDGAIEAGTEFYSSFEIGSSAIHSGTAWAPGMMGVVSCDQLYVFRF